MLIKTLKQCLEAIEFNQKMIDEFDAVLFYNPNDKKIKEAKARTLETHKELLRIKKERFNA